MSETLAVFLESYPLVNGVAKPMTKREKAIASYAFGLGVSQAAMTAPEPLELWKKPFRINGIEPNCYEILDAEDTRLFHFETDDAAKDLAEIQLAEWHRILGLLNA